MHPVSLFIREISHTNQRLSSARGDLTAQPSSTPLKMAYGEGKMSAACTNESGLCTDSPAINRTLYRYDALGQRVEKLTGDGKITRYLYDAGQLAAEYTNAPVTDSGRRYLTTDHLGTTRVMTDSSGTVTVRRDYFPFGEEISPATLATGNLRSTISAYGDNTISSTTVRFTGKERDAETGLDYFRARYLSSAQGRFTGADIPLLDQSPLDLGSWNLFTYSRNNPLLFSDLDGRKCVRKPDGSFEGDCASPGDEKVTQADKPQVSNVEGRQGSLFNYLVYQAFHSGTPRTVPNDVPLPASTRRIFTQVYYNTAVLTPCGGGAFAFVGRDAHYKAVHGELLGVVNLDSEEGASVGAIGEVGVGPFSMGGEAQHSFASGKISYSGLGFLGKEIRGQAQGPRRRGFGGAKDSAKLDAIFVGALVDPAKGEFGGYGSLGVFGVGAYGSYSCQ